MSTEREVDPRAAGKASAVVLEGGIESAGDRRNRVDAAAIIVVNFGSHELIRQNLGCVSWASSGFRVVVVDNFSTSIERYCVRSLVADHGWDLVEAPDNRGFGAGVDLGIAAAFDLGCTTFVLINPDARLETPVAAALLDECRHRPLALVAPKIIASDGSVFFDGALLDMTDGKVRGAPSVSQLTITPQGGSGIINGRVHEMEPWLTGACVALGYELYDRIGGMDDRFFLYWEDIDLSYRARHAGAELIIRRDLTVIHDEGGTQQPRRGRAKSNLYYYYNCRNRLLFAAARLPRRQIARWMVTSVSASWAILMQGGRRQLLHSPGPLFSAVSGTFAGLAFAFRALSVPRQPVDDATKHGGLMPRSHRSRQSTS